jgi:hypothetical protein
VGKLILIIQMPAASLNVFNSKFREKSKIYMSATSHNTVQYTPKINHCMI